VPSVSSDRNDLLDGIFRYPAECILASVEEDQRDGFLEVVQAFFLRAPLAVGAWELRAERDEPISVFLDNCSKLIGHLYGLLTCILSHLPEHPATLFPVFYHVGTVSQPGKGSWVSFQPVGESSSRTTRFW